MNIYLIYTFHQIFHDHNVNVKTGHRMNKMSILAQAIRSNIALLSRAVSDSSVSLLQRRFSMPRRRLKSM